MSSYSAHDSAPKNDDTDGDGLPDGWEVDNGFDPLAVQADGIHGAGGDPDGDGLTNLQEFRHGTDPLDEDTDGDGLTDLEETGGIAPADIPWFDLSAADDITALFPGLDSSCLTVPLAAPAVIRGTVFTNLTLDVNGLVYLNPAGYRNTAYPINGGWDMAAGHTVNAEALTVAPFWSDLVLVTNAAPASRILSGTASDGTNLYSVVEYRDMRRRQDRDSTGTLVTFQLAVPAGAADRVSARYALASGNNDGRHASVGVQGPGGIQKDSWCFEQAGGVWPGLSLAFVVGTGSDPRKVDTDDDGLTDLEEAALGTDPWKWDTDGDGLSDSDEADVHGTDPLRPDTDNDGLSDYDELNVHFTDPFNPDTDGDSVTDGGEAAQGADPLDPDDVPSYEWFTLTGNLEQDAVKTLERTIRIPAGQSRLVVVALHSDEYPEYTEDSSKFNDILTWDVTPASGPPVSGSVDVNSRHSAWGDGIELNGFDPVCVEGFHTLAAPAGEPMTVAVRLTAKNIADSRLPSTVMVGVMNARFVDKTPNYALEQGADSDNFFLREKDGSGNPDHENLDIYYSLGLPGLPVSDVKIKVYKGESSTPELVLDGVKDADGNYRTGDNLHTNWTASVDLAEDHPGFYRLQLSVSVEGQGAPALETSIADADGATPGWQCPQDCLAVHDLVWKHRPVVHVHEDEIGLPSSIVEFMVESGDATGARVKEWIDSGSPTVHPTGTIPTSINSFWDLFFDDKVTGGDLSDYTASQIAVLTTDSGEETVCHSADTTDADNFVFLQFWMFENFSRRPFGIFGMPFNPNVQHEGDMEHCQIAVRLADPSDLSLKAKWVTPFGATASQHYYAQTLKWDLHDGSSPANAHSQEHVEHVNNRLAIYVALGAHATYFAGDANIEVPDVNGHLGTQQQYDPNPEGAYDISAPAVEIDYELVHVDDILLGTFNGRWGYLLNGNPDSFSNGPSGPPHRSAHTASGNVVNLRNQPRTLHNLSRKTSQITEMEIP
jgi:hypothetical protein